MKKILFLGVVLISINFRSAYSQANTVVNSSFNLSISGWTSTAGWGWGFGQAVNYTNDNVTQSLSQSLTNVLVSANKISIKFDYQSGNCVCAASVSYTNLDVSFGGTSYLTLAAPTGTGNVSATLFNGATINTSSFAQGTLTSLVLTIPWTGSSPASGTLSFTHRPAGGFDDDYIDNVFVAASLTPIPVKLTRFSGSPRKEGAYLQWETASEIGFNEFEIENSNDGISFHKMGMVKASGNPDGSTYSFNSDYMNFFRLKMVDIDGKFEYSNIIRVFSNSNQCNAASVFPNPLSESTFSLQVNNQRLINTMAMLCSMEGKRLKMFAITGNSQTVSIDDFPAGIYFLKLDDGQVLKIIKH